MDHARDDKEYPPSKRQCIEVNVLEQFSVILEGLHGAGFFAEAILVASTCRTLNIQTVRRSSMVGKLATREHRPWNWMNTVLTLYLLKLQNFPVEEHFDKFHEYFTDNYAPEAYESCWTKDLNTFILSMRTKFSGVSDHLVMHTELDGMSWFWCDIDAEWTASNTSG
jgi:hypothetical protein